MKNYINSKILILSLLATSLFVFFSCEEGLDYENTNAIVPDAVWKDPNMIDGFLNDIYGGLNPGWIFNATESDEGLRGAKDMSNYLRGILTVDDSKHALDYQYIDKINYFLHHLKDVPADVLLQDEKKVLEAQAKFWRAWAYWEMVKKVGGVPLILEPQDISNIEALYKSRNKTSECMVQILQDLDDAIAILPGRYADQNDYGRITKAAAMAFKGKVLLWYASPLFNADNQIGRWQTAYEANKAAVDFLKSEGYGLYPDYRNLWYDERNEEVIMVNQYFFPGHAINFNVIRPGPFTKDAADYNQPLLPLLLAFPKRDGSPMELDVERLKNDLQYNAEFMADFYANRDDRFYTTIYYGGTPYPTPDIIAGQNSKVTFWNAWRWSGEENKYNTLLLDYNIIGNPGVTGFYDKKGLDTTLITALVANGQTDWIEIRYAEVLMNFGECANEVGKTQEALQVLFDIRERAGIESGNGNYGITASERDEIHMAYIRERQAEFAYENKRLGDLRRLKRYDLLNEQETRRGLYLVLKPGEEIPGWTETIMEPEVRTKFRLDYVESVDGDNSFRFNLSLNHWFYPLDPNQISQSMNKLEQNNEWGGSFNPLE